MTIRNAMVLAAGLGTRMRPITDTTPKPLVRVAGKPLIDYALDALVTAGARTIAVNVHHHAEQMIAHLRGRDDAEIVISDERDGLLNSGGGLAKGVKMLEPGLLFVMNADLFWIGEGPGPQSNLARLSAFFDPDRMDMALLCVPNEKTTGHNGRRDFHLAGHGGLTRYRDGDGNPVVYAGAMVLDSRLFDDAPAGAFDLNLYFDRAIEKGRLYGLMLDGHWITVGTPEAIGEAESKIAELQGESVP